MSKFDTIRSVLEEIADPQTNEETLRVLNLAYRNAQEIISCYPDVATFLINVVNAVETFPMRRVNQAKKNIKENILAFKRECEDEDDAVYEEENWEQRVNHRLRTALREQLKMPPTPLNEMIKKIDCAQGRDYSAIEAKSFLACQRAADQIFLKATVSSNGDTYYLIKTYSKYAVFIQNEDHTGTLYEVKHK
jgi:hypothetical protein